MRARRYTRGRAAGLLAVVVALVVVALVPPMERAERVSWRADWGTWVATTAPPRVDLCGHHYYPGGELHTLAWVEAQVAVMQKDRSGVGPWTGLKRISVTPAGTPVLANTPLSQCATSVVYVNVSRRTYEPYNGDAGG